MRRAQAGSEHAARAGRIQARRSRRQDPSTPPASCMGTLSRGRPSPAHAQVMLRVGMHRCSQQVPYIFVCTAVQRLLNQVPINNIISLCTRTCAFVCVCLGTRVCVAPCSTLVDGRPSASARRRRRPVFPLRLIDHVHRPWPPILCTTSRSSCECVQREYVRGLISPESRVNKLLPNVCYFRVFLVPPDRYLVQSYSQYKSWFFGGTSKHDETTTKIFT